jgi:hypothetical protein
VYFGHFQRFLGVLFCHFRDSKGSLVILNVLRVFWIFWEYIF